ncbi:MAG: metal dependent phosphohydrolase [Firmicutes bacterium]|nr:metal dependent phosphohydrolase [Bacillota bacterium]
MLNRVKQVVAAFTAKVSPEDRAFIGQHLNAREEQLFYSMNLPDQRHALNVAYTAQKLALAYKGAVDAGLLVRCALLHDVGKRRGDVSTWDKIITVLIHKLFSERAKHWGRYGRGGKIANIRHAVYIYFHHPERSVDFLQSIGTKENVIDIVRRHHAMPRQNDPVELNLLRQADDLH